jgi:hypothetical protein
MNTKNTLAKAEKLIGQMPSPELNKVKHFLRKEFIHLITTISTTDDIDGEGNPPPKLSEGLTALRFLITWYNWIYQEYNITPIASYIFCETDGGFGIHFETEKYALFMMVKTREDNVAWYGYNGNKKMEDEELIETKSATKIKLKDYEKTKGVPEFFLKFQS